MGLVIELGKQADDPNCLDRISTLPGELLIRMLSYLPTRSSASTSILSTRWRYLFTWALSSLSFDDAPCFKDRHFIPAQINEDRKKVFMEFVDNVLELNQLTHIKIFTLVCHGVYDSSVISAWVSSVVQKGVEELNLDVAFIRKIGNSLSSPSSPFLPDALFICETLLNLKMKLPSTMNCGECRIKIPLSAWLPRLKILHLSFIVFHECGLERLFSGCQLLEDLTLKHCRSCTLSGHPLKVTHSSKLLKVLHIERCTFNSGLFIDAPNLVYLTYCFNYTGVRIVPSWENSCSFVKAELYFNHRNRKYINDSVMDDREHDRELLKAAAHRVAKLLLIIDSAELLLMIAGRIQVPDFHSLARLTLSKLPFRWDYVTNLLDKSPLLELLVFSAGLEDCDSILNEDLKPFTCNAKVIEVSVFKGSHKSLVFLRHLLREARYLKKLILCKSNSVRKEEILQIREGLLMLPRASKDCCIELNRFTTTQLPDSQKTPV